MRRIFTDFNKSYYGRLHALLSWNFVLIMRMIWQYFKFAFLWHFWKFREIKSSKFSTRNKYFLSPLRLSSFVAKFLIWRGGCTRNNARTWYNAFCSSYMFAYVEHFYYEMGFHKCKWTWHWTHYQVFHQHHKLWK